jgi:hypothetical protein
MTKFEMKAAYSSYLCFVVEKQILNRSYVLFLVKRK